MGTDKIELVTNTKRNATLDFLKLIAAYMVVFIYVPFYGDVGMVVSALARFAVPVFFMTSGYFCYQNDTERIKSKIKHILIILIFTSLLYNAMNFFIAYSGGGVEGINRLIIEFKEIKNWISLLVFNEPFSATRLWFLFALIYVYVLQLILNRLKVNCQSILAISTVALVVNLILGEVFSILEIRVPEYYVRNFLLTGYPFFGFGLLLHSRPGKGPVIKNAYLIIALICGISLTILSASYAPYVALSAGAVIMTFALFLLALKYSNKEYPKWMMCLFECSLGIYIFHRVLTTVCGMVLNILGISNMVLIYNTLLPVCVCIATTLFVLVFNKINFRMQKAVELWQSKHAG